MSYRILLLLIGTVVCAQQARSDSDVAPILKANCAGCHGDSVKMKELNLTTEESVLKGSESGPVVVPGKPEESLLYKKVRDGSMPMGKPHLSEQQIETILSWIKGGAPA